MTVAAAGWAVVAPAAAMGGGWAAAGLEAAETAAAGGSVVAGSEVAETAAAEMEAVGAEGVEGVEGGGLRRHNHASEHHTRCTRSS